MIAVFQEKREGEDSRPTYWLQLHAGVAEDGAIRPSDGLGGLGLVSADPPAKQSIRSDVIADQAFVEARKHEPVAVNLAKTGRRVDRPSCCHHPSRRVVLDKQPQRQQHGGRIGYGPMSLTQRRRACARPRYSGRL